MKYVGGVGAYTSVSCPTIEFCVAADGDAAGFIQTLKAAPLTWGSPVSIAPNVITPTAQCLNYLTSVSCASLTFCMAVDYLGLAYSFDGVSWSKAKLIDLAN
jgi:hypothetical protein